MRRRSQKRSSSTSARSPWLAETLSRLAAAQTLEEALDITAATVAEQTGAKSVQVFIEHQGHLDEPITIYKSVPVVSEGEIKASAARSNYSRYQQRRMMGNTACWPLRSRGRALGALLLRDFTASDEQMSALDILAGGVALALDNLILCHNEWSRLPNLPAIRPMLSRALKHAQGSVAFFFFDIDDFKGVNSKVGYFGGAELLVQIARRLRACEALKPGSLGHISGDEFVLILPLTDRKQPRLKEALRAIKSTVQSPFLIHGQSIAITVSIGVSVFPDDAETAEELLTHADSAALMAKRAGKSAYRVYRRRTPL